MVQAPVQPQTFLRYKSSSSSSFAMIQLKLVAHGVNGGQYSLFVKNLAHIAN
jgi:hypothetical protein